MKIEIGKIYLTKHGRFVNIDSQPWEGIFNGNYEEDGRNKEDKSVADIFRFSF